MAAPAGNDPMEPSFEPVGELRVPSREPRDTEDRGPSSGTGPAEPPAAKPRREPSAGLDLEALRIRPEQAPADRARRRGPWKVLLVLVLMAFGGYLVWQEVLPRVEKAQRPRVTVATARLATPREKKVAGAFSAGGWIKLPQYHPVYVTPLIEGLVEELLVIEGDAVEKGQVIARLYAKDYCAECEAAEAAVEAAEAAYEKMKAGYRKQEVAEAKAAVDRLEAELETARAILEHSEELRPSGAISEEELLRDRMRVKTLEADRERARQVLARLEEGYRAEDIALAKAALEKAKAERDLAKLKLDYVEIKSPMKGVVLQRLASRGQWVKPADGRLVSLYDPADLEASVDIGQDELGRVFLGQTVEIVTRAEPDRIYEGTVVLIEPRADLVKNVVPVRVKIQAKPGDLLFPDMVVKARFLPKEGEEPAVEDEESEPVLTVPQGAVFAEGGTSYVMILSGGKVARRAVEVGRPSKGRVVVLEGLEDGERVVTSNPGALAEGAAVEIAR